MSEGTTEAKQENAGVGFASHSSDVLLSHVATSNLYTMHIAGKSDPRQALPRKSYVEPPYATRELRARLIIEEVFEQCRDLGIDVRLKRSFAEGAPVVIKGAKASDVFEYADSQSDFNMEEAIDGCIDAIYVATGTLCALGVPDMPHQIEVCNQNNAKFPGGVGILANGKYQKPPGWTPPNHGRVSSDYADVNLASIAEDVFSIMAAGDEAGVNEVQEEVTEVPELEESAGDQTK